MCAQITEVPLTDVFESEKGSYSYPEINVSFNCFPVTDDEVNTEAAKLLEFLLSDDAGDDRLIVDTQTFTDTDKGGYYSVGDLTNPYGLRLSGASKSEQATYASSTRSNYTSNRSISTDAYDYSKDHA
jgi:hypothetical protein